VSERQPSEEELRAALEEQMKRISVRDVLLQTVVTLVNLGGRRLGLAGTEDERDLEQAKLSIDATRALMPLLPEEEANAVREALSQLQMAYVREQQQAGAPPSGAEGGGEAPAAGGPSAEEEAERARARSKIWTPPGT
jgi:hypothetical protein